jgi:deoxyribose-phosphate aldolase
MACLDLTSLSGNETVDDITILCGKAKDSPVSAVCIYPRHVKQAADQLAKTDVQIATVINFPFGNLDNDGSIATPENTRATVLKAISDGATEIDIVMDYQGYHAMETDLARELLNACRDACGDNIKMKVILESSAFRFEREVYDMAKFAMDYGADMIKTSTGKHENGGASFEMVAAMALAVDDYKVGRSIGLKISGGVNNRNYAQFIAITENMFGADCMAPDRFRIGASGLYDDLCRTLETKEQVKLHAQSPSGY